ncbi:MAG: hypothetical protein HQL87_16670 [Magnetococcales bacterium]|nr:hypothetical protein [Magnetococcales bacterium]
MTEQQSFMPAQFRVGHLAIDMQHELLFALYHELMHSLQHEDDAYELLSIFLGLNGYVDSHFKYEEEAMREARYPDWEVKHHCAEHRRLEQDVQAFYQRFVEVHNKEAERKIAYEVATFLADWLKHHIAEVDRQLARHLNEQSADAHQH